MNLDTKEIKYLIIKQSLMILNIDTIDLNLIVKMLNDYLSFNKYAFDRETIAQLSGIIDNLENINKFIHNMEDKK